jgi:putative ABC transport system permease protein
VEIVGVMPRDFDFPRGTGAWMPAAPLIRKDSDTYGGAESSMRWLRVFFALGRLKQGISLEGATRELTHVMRTAKADRAPEPNQALVLTPVAAYLLGPAGPVLWTLLAGAVLMLTIACANVAGLQVSRAARRQRAVAIRVALGASRRHLFWQVVIESGLVTVLALASAVAVAYFTILGLLLLAPAEVPRLGTVTLFEWPVLAAGTGVTFATMLVTGLWPALAARRVEAVSLLAHGAGAAADPRGRRVQRAIVVAQVAVALTLLAGTGLFVRTLYKLDRTTLGFQPDRLLALSIAPPTEDPTRWNAYYHRLIRRVERLPGVTGAGAVQLRPLSGPVGWESQPFLPGQVAEDPSTWGLNPHMNLQTVTPGYFRAMEIRLVRGRVFTDRDTANAPGAVIVSESTARRLWPGSDPLGRRMAHHAYVGSLERTPRWQTVVGVVEDVRYRGLNDVRLDCYMPATQSRNTLQQLMIRTSGIRPAWSPRFAPRPARSIRPPRSPMPWS